MTGTTDTTGTTTGSLARTPVAPPLAALVFVVLGLVMVRDWRLRAHDGPLNGFHFSNVDLLVTRAGFLVAAVALLAWLLTAALDRRDSLQAGAAGLCCALAAVAALTGPLRFATTALPDGPDGSGALVVAVLDLGVAAIAALSTVSAAHRGRAPGSARTAT